MKKKKADNSLAAEFLKSAPHIVLQIVEYIPESVLSKTILKKVTGNITAMSVDTGETIAEQTLAFDTFIQIIDGAAEITINKEKHQLGVGDGIIIPAHALHSITANEQFKMVSTIIKSGYEDVPVLPIVVA